MLLWLTEYLSGFVGGFAVFQYLTLRTMVSVVTALLMSLLIGPVMIKRLTQAQIGQTIEMMGLPPISAKRAPQRWEVR